MIKSISKSEKTELCWISIFLRKEKVSEKGNYADKKGDKWDVNKFEKRAKRERERDGITYMKGKDEGIERRSWKGSLVYHSIFLDEIELFTDAKAASTNRDIIKSSHISISERIRIRIWKIQSYDKSKFLYPVGSQILFRNYLKSTYSG